MRKTVPHWPPKLPKSYHIEKRAVLCSRNLARISKVRSSNIYQMGHFVNEKFSSAQNARRAFLSAFRSYPTLAFRVRASTPCFPGHFQPVGCATNTKPPAEAAPQVVFILLSTSLGYLSPAPKIAPIFSCDNSTL